MQDRDFRLDGVGLSFGVEILNDMKFLRKLFDIVTEIREVFGQMQVAAESDTVNGTAQQRSSDAVPVAFCLRCRVSAFHESRRAAESYGEQIGMQPEFMHRNIYAGTEPCFKT